MTMEPPEQDDKPSLWDRARRSPVTALLTVINVAWFLWAESHGSTMEPENLLRFGAVEPHLVGAGEFWRMGSYMFLHIGWVHLIWNSWAGASWCTSVERALGPIRFLIVYLAAGIGGGAASVLFSPAISAGASGAMFGIVGATLAIRRRQLPSFRHFTSDRGVRATFANIALWTVIGIVAMPMNHFAHFGGLILGGVATLIATSKPPRMAKWAAFAVAFAALLVVAWKMPLAFAFTTSRASSSAIDWKNVSMTRSRLPAGTRPERIVQAAPSACKAGIQKACIVHGASLMSSDKPRDLELALALLHRACEVGEADGCAGEGDMYISGLGVTQDIDRGRKLGNDACARGSEWGCDVDPLKGLDLPK